MILQKKDAKMEQRTLTPEDIRKIEMTLAKDQRVEVIPTKDGVRVVWVQRETVK